jgi:glutamate-ammonia-ligase adenylyltransferase
MFRIDLRHITGQTDFVQFSEELTELADVTVAIAADLCHAALAPAVGVPTLADGRPCGWSICALGKFGGRELGFGSDLELIFVYEDEGTTSGPAAIPNAEYFIRFVQTFLSMLRSARRAFEIDLRLRPHGKAGALACSAAGFAQYYRESGPAESSLSGWRWSACGPVAGDDRLGQRLTAARDAFVYSGRPLTSTMSGISGTVRRPNWSRPVRPAPCTGGGL